MSIPVRALVVGLAFAILVGGACSFIGSPWSTAWDWPFVWPIVAGAAAGFVFGLIAALRRRMGWVVWILTLPAMVAWTWVGIGQCNAQPTHDDCELAWVLPLGWLVPWVIGIVVLGLSTVVAVRRAPASTPPRRHGGLLGVVLVIAAACAGPGSVASPSPTPSGTPMPADSPTVTPQPTPTLAPTPGIAAQLTWQAVAVPAIGPAAWVDGIAARSGPSPLFVAVGVGDLAAANSSAGGNWHNGAAWISSDGTTWQLGATIDTAVRVLDVAYGASRFVAVGAWSGKPASSQVTLASYAGGYPPGVWTSVDGRSWTGEKLPAGNEASSIAFGDRGFVAIGSDARCGMGCGPADNPVTPIFHSADGLTWGTATFTGGQLWTLAALPGHGYVAGGPVADTSCPDGTTGAVWTSSDGLGWVRAAVDTTCAGVGAVIADDAGYLAVGATPSTDTVTGHVVAWSSPDGLTWGHPIDLTVVGDASSDVLGTVDGAVVLANSDGIWELVGDAAARSSDASITFSAFGGGIGLAVGDKGGVVAIPEPAP